MATTNNTLSKPSAAQTIFLWEGKDKAGRPMRGEMRAQSEAIVSSTLRRQGILVSKIKRRRFGSMSQITEKDITLFTRHLATMIKSGIPLLQSFDIVSKGSTKPSMARLINEIRGEIETGSNMNQAFRKYPLYFDPLFCNIVAAGEQAGILEHLLDKLATHKEKILKIKGKIRSAMFYPVAVVVVAVGVTAVIMIKVVPEFKKIFTSFGAELPFLTQAVIKMSDWTVKNWWLLLLITIPSIYFFFQSWKRSEKFKRFMDGLLLRIPIFGPIIKKATIARWTNTLSTMFAAGVPLVESLDSVGGASGNQLYAEATQRIQLEVSSGTSLTVAMQNSNVFPGMVTQMVSIGEESGSLDEMLAKVGEFYEQEVDEAVDSLSTLIEPIIIVFLGVVVGTLVVAMYLPIFKLGSVV